MTVMTMSLRGIPDTQACIGWAGTHSIVVDRPQGMAGGRGLGFNGGQLLGLAIGGCLWNDLHYVADEMGIALTKLAVDVTVTFDGNPLRATGAAVQVVLEAAEENADLEALLRKAQETSTVSNSISRGVPISVTRRR